MQRARCVILRLAVVLMLGGLSSAAWGLSLTERVKLQAAMQVHVDRQTVDGVFLFFDVTSGQVRQLNPVSAHPKILTGENYHVLCFDFRDEFGNDVNVDFFMVQKGDEYIVLHTKVDQDSTLMRLMEAGTVTGPE